MRKLIIAAIAAASITAGTGAMAGGTANAATACTAQVGSNCGPYGWSGWPGSNGFNTYVMDQPVDPQPGSTGSITATSPSSWTAKANYTSCGGCVQTFTAVQQLTNNWNPAAKNFTGSSNLPLSVLSRLQVTYAESSPADPGNQDEFAPDVWDTQAKADVMFWADTSPTRCVNNGLNSSDILGQATLGSQQWTVYHFGAEVIIILDGTSSADPVSTGTCAQQKSGTIPILAGYKWLVKHGVQPSLGSLTQLNTGYEITAGDGTGQYAVTSLSYPVTIK